MKKMILSLGSLSVIFLLLFSVSALSGFSDDHFTYEFLENGTLEVNNYISDAKHAVIPDMVNGYPVTSIGRAAFSSTALDSLVIPDSITKIDENAFSAPCRIRSISLPKSFGEDDIPCLFRIDRISEIILPPDHPSLTVQEGVIFSKDQTKLLFYPSGISRPEYVVPNGVTSIGKHAFYGNDSLTKIILPDSLYTIGDYAFYHMDSLKSINLPDNLTFIGQSAFYTDHDWETMYMPDDLVYAHQIGYYGINPIKIEISMDHPVFSIENGCLIDKKQKELLCFLGDPAIKSITVPDGIEIINEYAFSHAENLEEIILPHSLFKIEDSAFIRCDSLKSLTIPDSVSHIGVAAFCACSSLESVTLPQSLTEIGDAAFSGCTALIEIIFPDNLNRIGEEAFSYCSNLQSVILPDSVTEIAQAAFCECENLVWLHLPASLETLGVRALFGCGSLKKLSFPLTLTSLGSEALGGTSQLCEIIVPAEHPVLAFVDGMLIDKGRKLVYYAVKEQLNEQLVLPEGMVEIAEGVFEDAEHVKSIVIPEGYEIIGSYAFSRLSELTHVTLPGTLKSIGEDAFRGSEQIMDIIIPESVENIGSNAFTTYRGTCFHVYPDSYAHKWAEENWLRYQLIE